jgi:hypothetical protein
MINKIGMMKIFDEYSFNLFKLIFKIIYYIWYLLLIILYNKNMDSILNRQSRYNN